MINPLHGDGQIPHVIFSFSETKQKWIAQGISSMDQVLVIRW